MRSSHRRKDKGCLLNGKFETSKFLLIPENAKNGRR